MNNQYTFVSHDAVVAAVRPSLVKHGLVVSTSLVEHTVVGNRVEGIYEVSYINIDDPADRHVVRVLGFGIDAQDKGPGKACSYATKYGILKPLFLETGDDPERDLIEFSPAPQQAVGQATKARKAYTPTASPKPPTPAPKPAEKPQFDQTLPDGGISPDAKAWAKQTLYAAGIIQQDRASLTPLLTDNNPKTKRAAELLLADLDLTEDAIQY